MDTEELALGPCVGSAQPCLFIGDIGDNDADRESISVAWIPEKQTFRSSEKIAGQVELVYPDGAHNAEAMVIRPNGDLVIFTKGSASRKALPSYAFKITAEELRRAEGSTATLKKIGTVDVPSILPDEDPENQIVTGAAVSDDGSRVLLLTYGHVLELSLDLDGPLKSTKDMKRGNDFTVTTVGLLPKQEAISYLPSSSAFLVTSEAKKKNAPVVNLSCLR